jgi:hypothetical protein
MKYRIPEHIIIEETPDAVIKDIIYHELNEQEFLIHYLQDPLLSYWQDHDDGTRQHYNKGKLVVTIKNGVVVNHSFLEKKC